MYTQHVETESPTKHCEVIAMNCNSAKATRSNYTGTLGIYIYIYSEVYIDIYIYIMFHLKDLSFLGPSQIIYLAPPSTPQHDRTG